jgi:hypothetical protein
MNTLNSMKNPSEKRKLLFEACKPLHSDYLEFGGKIKRFVDPDYDYLDCSCGCIYFQRLHDSENNDYDLDFGVCLNKKSNRQGLLTFEHQAGYGCFQAEPIR